MFSSDLNEKAFLFYWQKQEWMIYSSHDHTSRCQPQVNLTSRNFDLNCQKIEELSGEARNLWEGNVTVYQFHVKDKKKNRTGPRKEAWGVSRGKEARNMLAAMPPVFHMWVEPSLKRIVYSH